MIPLERRDVRVVEGARLESEAGQRCRATLQRVNAYAINDLTFQAYHSVCVAKPRCSSRFWTRRITVLSQSSLHLGRRLVAAAHHASDPADPRLLTPAYLIDQRLSQLWRAVPDHDRVASRKQPCRHALPHRRARGPQRWDGWCRCSSTRERTRARGAQSLSNAKRRSRQP